MSILANEMVTSTSTYILTKGEFVRQITQGDWEVSELLSIDEEQEIIYYLSTEVSPLERHLYAMIAMDGKKKRRLSEESGTHQVAFSPRSRYYVDRYSSVRHPLVVNCTPGSFGQG